MNRREAAFLLIGLGIGLLLAVVMVTEFVFWFHHMYILGVKFWPGSFLLALPFLLILAGIVLLLERRRVQKSD